jgi:hypothetical protein
MMTITAGTSRGVHAVYFGEASSDIYVVGDAHLGRWSMRNVWTDTREALLDRVCRAHEGSNLLVLTPAEMTEPILRGRTEMTRLCARQGALSVSYWADVIGRLPALIGQAWSTAVSGGRSP